MPLSMVFPAFMALLFLLSLPFIRGAERRFVLIALAVIGALWVFAFGGFQATTGINFPESDRSGVDRALILLFFALATLAAGQEALRDALGPFGSMLGVMVLGMLGAGALWLARLHRRASRKPTAQDHDE
jgi:hypothetical protein